MKKLCGNCAGDHKYDDCPFIHFRVTKAEWEKILENREKARKLEKTESRLKMMEISFEQINNSRNDLIKQLAEQERINEQNQKLRELIEKRIEELKNPVNSIVPDNSDMIPEPSHKLWELQKHLSFEEELQKLLRDSKK